MKTIRYKLFALCIVCSMFFQQANSQEIAYTDILDKSGETFVMPSDFTIGHNNTGGILLADRVVLNKQFKRKHWLSTHLIIICKELLVEEQVNLRMGPRPVRTRIKAGERAVAYSYENDNWRKNDHWSSLSIYAKKIVFGPGSRQGMLSIDMFLGTRESADASQLQLDNADINIVADSILSIDSNGNRVPISMSNKKYLAVNRYVYKRARVENNSQSHRTRTRRNSDSSKADKEVPNQPRTRSVRNRNRKTGETRTVTPRRTTRVVRRNGSRGENSNTNPGTRTGQGTTSSRIQGNASSNLDECKAEMTVRGSQRTEGEIFYHCADIHTTYESINQYSDTFSNRPGVRKAVSVWTISQLKILYNLLLSAQAQNDFGKEFELLSKYQEYAKVSVISEEREEFQKIVASLNQLRDARSWALQQRTVTVDKPGHSGLSVPLFTEGATLDTRIAPTNALVVRHQNSTRSVLGLIEFDREKGDEITMTFELMLTADPWVMHLVEQELKHSNEKLAGVFGGWSLSPHRLEDMGIVSGEVEQTGGNRLQVSLTLSLDNAGVVLWKLFSNSGLPLAFEWEYRNAGKYEQGQWQSPPISLTRRSSNDLDILNGHIVNHGRSRVFVEYVRIGDDRFERLFSDTRAVLPIAPGESVELPPTLRDEPSISIPPEAVSYEMDHTHFDEDFHIINGADLIQKMTVANRLPAYDEALGGRLDYVEITLTDLSSTNLEGSQVTFRLAPSGSEGDETTIPFIKSVHEVTNFSISGRAFYEHGEHGLPVLETQDLTYYITRDLLPEY